MRKRALKRFVLYLLMSWLICLQGCSTKDQPMQGMRIGMHIDAVLQFIVEYPLDWTKDRRINYGSYDGEVRWTHPNDASIMLRVLSYQRKEVPDDPTERLTKNLPGHHGQAEVLRERNLLPAGEATHIITEAPEADIEAYQLAAAERDYTIILIVPHKQLADYNDIMTRVSQSFRFVQ